LADIFKYLIVEDNYQQGDDFMIVLGIDLRATRTAMT
jgi:hypothetical protein